MPGFEELKDVPARFRKFPNPADYETKVTNGSDSIHVLLNMDLSQFHHSEASLAQARLGQPVRFADFSPK